MPSQDPAQQVPLPAWPVFALAHPPSAGWLCGLGQSHDGVHVVRIDYAQPFAPERLLVQTHPHDQTLDLAGVLQQLESDLDDGEPLATGAAPSTGSSPSEMMTILVDDEPISAVAQRADSASVYCAHIRDVTVLVCARLVSLAGVRLVQVTDLAPFQAARRHIVESLS